MVCPFLIDKKKNGGNIRDILKLFHAKREGTMNMKRILSAMLALALVITMSVVAIPTESAHAETKGFFTYYTNYDGTCRIASYSGDEVDLVIPSYLDGHKVVSIGGFGNKKYVKNIKFPKYLKTIESACFKNCTGLESVTIPATVEGADGFQNCTNLKKVVIAEGVKKISSVAFLGCTSLESVTIPSTVTEIGNSAFEDTTALKSITLPETLKVIGSCAFQRSGITSMNIPDKVKEVGFACFRNCTSLKTLVVGKYTKDFGPSGEICNGCTSLESVDFSKNIRMRIIENESFKGCTSLKSVTTPKNLEEIQYDAFYECSSLSSITFNEGLKTIEAYILKGTLVTSVHLPKTIQVVHGLAFDNSNVTNIQFDGTVSSSKNPDLRFFDDADYTVSFYDNSEFLKLYSQVTDPKTTVTTRSAVPSTGLTLSKSNVKVVEGTPLTVTATVTPSNTTDGVVWESSDERVCHVSQTGILSYEGEGSAIVTAKTVTGKVAQVSVVCQKLPTSLKVVNSSGNTVSKVSLKKGKTKKLKGIVDYGRTDVKLKWSSSNSKVAKVSSTGKITAVKRGTCKIYCKTAIGSLKKTISVTVK